MATLGLNQVGHGYMGINQCGHGLFEASPMSHGLLRNSFVKLRLRPAAWLCAGTAQAVKERNAIWHTSRCSGNENSLQR